MNKPYPWMPKKKAGGPAYALRNKKTGDVYLMKKAPALKRSPGARIAISQKRKPTFG